MERHIGESDKYVRFNRKIEILLRPVPNDKEGRKQDEKEKEEIAWELRDERKIWKSDVYNLSKRAEKKMVDLTREINNMKIVLQEYDDVKAIYKRMRSSI